MKNRFKLGALAASLVWLPTAFASDSRIECQGGIGSTPFAVVNAAPGPNDVRGIAPGGCPWVIEKLQASIRSDGAISVKGKGLLLAGGNSVGLPALPRQVLATLFCGATELTSPPADLDANGNFTTRGMLAAALPDPCQTPTLLIRNFSANAIANAAGAWFAAGIPEN